MDTQTLTEFFMWSTIINVALFAWATVWFMLAPDLTYRIQTKFFPMPREKFNVIIYAFLGVFKIFILVFNIAPYVALLIIG
ncbi:MAG: hypothetical protein HKN28_19550 [Alphaproteobacteria bacterium]|nr:hypothetical protein [Alphaproteobacteria bacterium]